MTERPTVAHRYWKLLSVTFVLLLSGCAQLGPDLVKAGRNDYNQVLAQTADEETLLNLVRLRYADNPAFLKVASVSTSFTWNQGLSGEGFAYEQGSVDSNVGVRGKLDYTERPTITYTPLGGSDFVENVLAPMDLDLILVLARSGWSIDRVLRLTVANMNGIENAPEASGPTPREAPVYAQFLRATKLMRALQKQRAVTLGYREVGEQTIAGVRIDPKFRQAPALRELAELLGIDVSHQLITLDSQSYLRRADAIGFETRSLVGILFFLSHGVQIPQQDISAGRVTVTRDADGQPFDWSRVMGDLLAVRSAKEAPSNAAVAVKYRGHWFYVDDADMQSKYTLMLLEQISALQAGKVERTAPLLTLPVTGP